VTQGSRATKLLLTGINLMMLPLAVLGISTLRRHRAILALLLALVAYRTLVPAYFGACETRYVISSFPAVVVLAVAGAAVLWRGVGQRASQPARRPHEPVSATPPSTCEEGGGCGQAALTRL